MTVGRTGGSRAERSFAVFGRRSALVASGDNASCGFRLHGIRFSLICLLLTVLVPTLGSFARADDATEALSARQISLATRFQKLEALLLRLADMEAAENPERASLLKRAAKQSRDRFVLTKLQDAASSLDKQRFQDAVDQQETATKELAALLKLLLTEDRSKRIRDEKQRIAKVIRELKRVERSQRSTRARTENGADTDQLKREQESLSERAESLSDDLDDGESESSEPSDESNDESSPQSEDADSKDSESDESDGEQGDAPEPDESDAKDPKDGSESDTGDKQEPQDSSAESSESSPSESSPKSEQDSQPSQSQSQESQSQQSESQPSDSQQSESQQSESSDSQPSGPQPPQSPQAKANDQLQQAIEKMRQAEKDLEEAKRDDAVEKQREAEKQLRQAIDQLEQILRQLREEEMQRELAKLEARLRQMAAMQSKILDDTTALSQTPKAQRNRQTDLKAGDLAFEEKKVTLDADRAMLLLREEGSSVAFPEVISQIRDDTVVIAQRLSQTKIDGVTKGMQEDVLAALEEMIAALQKAQNDLEKKKQQNQQPQQPGQPGEEPLVQALAELKLIRTIQTRIQSTTRRYSGLIQTGETTSEEVQPLLQDLAERQSRLYRITRDLALERNQ